MAISDTGLIPAERRNRIHEIIRDQGIVRVSTLSGMFGVAEVTIRRDLEQLEHDDLLVERTHGGAVFSRRMRSEPSYSEKDQIHLEEKEQIGFEAAALIEDGDILLINSGSTTKQIFQHLADRKNLRVITSNLGALEGNSGTGSRAYFYWRSIPGGIKLPGGAIIPTKFAASLCQQVFHWRRRRQYQVRFNDTGPARGRIARTMIERTRGQVIVMADHHKLGVVADFQSAPIEKIDILVMDNGFDESYRKGLEDLGIEVVVASGGTKLN